MLDLSTSRLTSVDYNAMKRRLRETIYQYGRGYQPKWSDVPTLERLARHAIGCSEADLRDSELAEVHDIVVDMLGLGQ
jgi:hypothetical protein